MAVDVSERVRKLAASIVVVAVDACTQFGTALVGGVEGEQFSFTCEEQRDNRYKTKNSPNVFFGAET